MKIGIIGLGLIGGSIGLKLQTLNHEVFGVVNNEYNAKIAEERKLATYVSTELDIIKDCSLIFLALPIKNLIEPNEKLINSIPINAIVTDVASVKEPIVNKWEKLHPLFIGSHPMAGTEDKGVKAGRETLLNNSKWIITPTSNTDQNSVKTLTQIITSLKCKIVTTTPQRHDEAVSLVSHLPIFLGSSLIQAAHISNNQTLLDLMQEIASTGYADTSRVGGGNSDLGLNLAMFNRENLLYAIKLFKDNLDGFEKMITEENWELISEKLEKAKEIRSQFVD